LAKAGPVFRPQITIRLEAVAVAGLDVRLIVAVAEKLELGRLVDLANRSGGMPVWYRACSLRDLAASVIAKQKRVIQ
jgi:hypothetical protein